MTIKSIIKNASLVTAPVFLSVVLAASVFAVGKPQDVGAQGQGVGHPNIPVTQEASGKLQACQAREAAIKSRSTHLTQLATTMETKFDSIAARVEDYYTNKVVPSGKTVSNYSTLVSDIQTKKAAVTDALTKAQADTTSFTCTSTNPKAQVTQFRDDMQAVKSALKDYRTSIKDLIVAVHSAAGTENSESPKPTK